MEISSDEAKGRVKEALGDLTGNEKLKSEGKSDQAAGEAKGIVQDVADKAEDLIDAAKKAVQKD
jgi:uncharacterized protein YjbJ (UPF0337 family)